MLEPKAVFVITNPRPLAGIAPVRNLILILQEIFPSIYLFTGNEGKTILKEFPDIRGQSVKYVSYNSRLLKMITYTRLQIQISLSLIRESKKYDCSIFLMAEGLFLPVIIAKILGKKPILCLAGSMQNMIVHTSEDSASAVSLKFMEEISYGISETILVYSSKLIEEWNLEKYRHKIRIAHQHFLDFSTFTVTTPLRPPLIGYIGRLSPEKGVQNFVQALPTIFNDRNELRALIGGDGQLKESIETSLEAEKISYRVDLPGWISYNDLPRFLNQLRLLVLPSYTEGLPNILLEAMACGTPVLATSVGAIPDVIRDGETGFIMENNSPECIAENVIRALSSPDLERIAVRGKRFVEEEYTFEKTVDRWKKVLKEN